MSEKLQAAKKVGKVSKASATKKNKRESSKFDPKGCKDIRMWTLPVAELEDGRNSLDLSPCSKLELTLTKFDNLNSLNSLSQYGFDSKQVNWTYPVNQQTTFGFEETIVETALFNNTLVRLPKGIDNGFISSVIISTFHHWFPEKLTVCIAPSLADLQLQISLYSKSHGWDTIGQQQSQTELETRRDVWKTKKVVFTTPYLFLEDLIENRLFKARNVRCLVFIDGYGCNEYHQYAAIVSRVIKSGQLFRVVLLTNSILEWKDFHLTIFQKLFISRTEALFLNAGDETLSSSSGKCSREFVTVGLDGYAKQVLITFMNCVKTLINFLIDNNENFGEGVVLTDEILQSHLLSYQNYRAFNTPYEIGKKIEKYYNNSIALLRASKVLQTHGVLTFYRHLKNTCKYDPSILKVVCEHVGLRALVLSIEQNYWITGFDSLIALSDERMTRTGLCDNLRDDRIKRIGDAAGHPKINKMIELIENHFISNAGQISRVVILSSYRTSCEEIKYHLNQLAPFVTSEVISTEFFDQSSYDEMKRAADIEKFKEGELKVIICQHQGIQKLELAELDLIVSFDAKMYPIVLFEKMQLPGRKRDGKIIFMTTGNEEIKILNENIEREKLLTDSSSLKQFCCRTSPRMAPFGMVNEYNQTRNATRSEMIQNQANLFLPPATNHSATNIDDSLTAGSRNISAPSFGITVNGNVRGSLNRNKQAKMAVEAETIQSSIVTTKNNVEKAHGQILTSSSNQAMPIQSKRFWQTNPTATTTSNAVLSGKSQILMIPSFGITANRAAKSNQLQKKKAETVTNSKKISPSIPNNVAVSMKGEMSKPIEIIDISDSQPQKEEASNAEKKPVNPEVKRLLYLKHMYDNLDPLAIDQVTVSFSQHHYEDLFSPRSVALLSNYNATESENAADEHQMINYQESKNSPSTQEKKVSEAQAICNNAGDSDFSLDVNPPKRLKKCGRVLDSQSTESDSFPEAPPSPINPMRRQGRREARNEFILDQAEVSGEYSEGTEEDYEGLSVESFIARSEVEETESQHAMYLRGLQDDAMFY